METQMQSQPGALSESPIESSKPYERRLHPQFLTNDKREPVSVLLPIDEYYELLEDLEDISAIAENRKRNEPGIPFEEVMKELELEDSLQD